MESVYNFTLSFCLRRKKYSWDKLYFLFAIASNLALGMTMSIAIKQAKKYITTAIEHSLNIGKGNGPTHYFYFTH